jgi:hypothetical protein
MKVRWCHKGVWAETEEIFEIDDDEVIGLLKRILQEFRDEAKKDIPT